MKVQSAVREVGRYELLQLIGAGGFSSVFEARDRGSGERVALKQLSRAGPSSVARFKQEFRAVQGIHHTNLVELRELLEVAGAWYIAMELVDGVDLISHLRRGRAAAFDASELQRCFAQLVAGLGALHAAGVIHRDLKPRNVLVTPSGRVVLLDFGLVERLGETRPSAGIGTAAYMAPEQVAGEGIGPATDFYALGVCMYEALTGRLPYAGNTATEVLQLKLQRAPPSPLELNPAVPAKLASLCMRLLERDPGRRPSSLELERALDPNTRATQARHATRRQDDFAGRESELARLSALLSRSSAGQCVLAAIEGESGVGKSALVAEFVQRVRDTDAGALVLRARCYENELTAYKAFDGAIDELAYALRQLPAAEQAALMPPRALLMPRLFPGLGAVPAIGSAAAQGMPADPSAQRVAALHALLQLLWNIGRRFRLVLAIDDLQWADPDSFRLLRMLADAERPPAMLVVFTVRAAWQLPEDAVPLLEQMRRLPGVEWLTLEGLSRAEAAGLAARLLRSHATESTIDALVAESQGHPLLLAELVHYVRASSTELSARRLSLTEALRTRIAALSEPSRRLLTAAAIGGRPYPPAVFAHVLEMDAAMLHAISGELLASKLLRRRAGRELECFHDQIRQAAVALVPADQRPALHAQFARAIAAQAAPDMAEVARHCDAAGQTGAAIDAYAQSSRHALTALSFARAEQLASRALELAAERGQELSPALRHELELRRAQALSCMGHSLEAAAQFQRAAQTAEGAARIQLQVRHAQQLLESTQLHAGLSAARALLTQLGISMPTSVRGLLAQIVWEEWKLRLFGARPGVVAAADRPQLRAQLEALWALAIPILWVEPLLKIALVLRHSRLARALGEPLPLARALAEEATQNALRNRPAEADRLMAAARAHADALGDPALEVVVASREATVAQKRGDAVRERERLEHALRVASERCPESPWTLTTLRVGMGRIWESCGAYPQLVLATREWIEEAAARDDRYGIALLRGLGMGYIGALVAGDAQRARAELAAAFEALPRERFIVPHVGELVAGVQIELYRGGRGARDLLEQQRPRYLRSGMWRGQFLRPTVESLQASAALAAFRDAEASERAALLRDVQACAGYLAGAGEVAAAGRLRVQVAVLCGEAQAAREQLRDCLQRSAALCELPALAAERYLEGLLAGGPQGAGLRRDALSFFEERGWKAPRRAIARFCPALDALEGAADQPDVGSSTRTGISRVTRA